MMGLSGHLGVMLMAGAVMASNGVAAGQVCDTSEFPLSAPDERFLDQGDGTVTDRLSGLTWMRCAVGQEWRAGRCEGDARALSWAEASAVAEAVNRSGERFFSDWRVPALPELATIVERQCRDPRINEQVFPQTPGDLFWTGTPRVGSASVEMAYALSFGSEGVVGASTDRRHRVRLVRPSE